MNLEQKNLVSRGLHGLLFVGAGVVNRANAGLVSDPLTEYRREIRWVTDLSLAVAGVGLFFLKLHRFVRWPWISATDRDLANGHQPGEQPRAYEETGDSPILAWLHLPAQALVTTEFGDATAPTPRFLAKKRTQRHEDRYRTPLRHH
jgi:hypothetical protein